MKIKPGYKLVKTIFQQHEEIPEEWDFLDISKFGKITGGGTPKSEINDYWEEGNIPWFTPEEITTLENNYVEKSNRKITQKGLENSSAKMLPKGSVLVTTRASIGDSVICKNSVSTNQGFQNIVMNKKHDNKFLMYSIRNSRRRLRQFSQGTTFLEISKTNFSKIRIPCPKTKDEEEKISKILSNFDDLIGNQKIKIESLEKLKKGHMQKLLSVGINHNKFKKIDWYYKKKIEIPEEWDVIPLQELLAKQNSGLHNKLDETSSGDNIVGMVDLYTHDVIDGERFTLASFPKEIKGKKIDKEKYLLKENDFLYIEISLVKNGIGKTVLVSKNGEGTYFAGNLRRFSIKKNSLNPKFLFYYLNSDLARNYMINHSYTTAQTGITMKDYFKMKILIPKKDEEAEKIASILENVDFMIKTNKKYKEKLILIKNGLMQQLLSGQMRVP